MSAGARLKVMWLDEIGRPQLRRALVTLSLLSLTAASGSPTRSILGSPRLEEASTSTK